MNRTLAVLLFMFFALSSKAGEIRGVVTVSGESVGEVLLVLNPGAWQALSAPDGSFAFTGIEQGDYTLQAYYPGHKVATLALNLSGALTRVNVTLEPLTIELETAVIEAKRTETGLGMARLSAVDGVGIYAAKKNEVILPAELSANKAVNNARQVYAKVPGLNIWESDQAGVQLGIGARGLSPDRTSNFNTRQNGYDIAADALGYPESYYTPPVEALERIELVRGAASLQYGTQFGGMLNFVLRKPPRKEELYYEGSLTGGSYGLFTTFHTVRARKGKLGVSAFYQYKQSDGWRPNSELNQHTGHITLDYALGKAWTLSGGFTHMQYLAHQPGGLTDAEFEENPGQSKRARNWFSVNWNVMSLALSGNLGANTRLDIRNFGLLASREALGDLSRINRQDAGGNRTYIKGTFRNIGNETRLLHNYKLLGTPANALVGVRLYSGFSNATQGDANDEEGPDFEFLNPQDPEGSDYDFPSTNIAAFTEHVFRPSHRFTVTPGLRFEYIRTDAEGYYKQLTRNFAGDIIAEEVFPESRNVERSFLLAGLGLGYRLKHGIELYANISQNYRAITFSDIRIDNPNFVVDPNLSDEYGYNADAGIRGNFNKILFFDISAYYLVYNNRIGFVTGLDENTFLEQRIRTNVGDSRSYGLESFVELNVYKWLFNRETSHAVSLFANLGLLNARYVRSEDVLVEGNVVELVPPVNLKTGLQVRLEHWRATLQYGYVGTQFTDAYNTEVPPVTAISGKIPAYSVVDLSAGYRWGKWEAEGGVTNLTNASYFTRRATGYPGPGVIPADPRMFFLTLRLRLNTPV